MCRTRVDAPERKRPQGRGVSDSREHLRHCSSPRAVRGRSSSHLCPRGDMRRGRRCIALGLSWSLIPGDLRWPCDGNGLAAEYAEHSDWRLRRFQHRRSLRVRVQMLRARPRRLGSAWGSGEGHCRRYAPQGRNSAVLVLTSTSKASRLRIIKNQGGRVPRRLFENLMRYRQEIRES